MDMTFMRRSERMLAQDRPVRLDHALLLAALAAQRSAESPARVRLRIERREVRNEEALVELVLAGPRWREAVSTQRGCFSRAEAGRRVNVP